MTPSDQEAVPWLGTRRDGTRIKSNPTDAAYAAGADRATSGLVEQLQRLCDDEWLRRRDRIMQLPGARTVRDSGAGEIEYAASIIRHLIEGLPGYDPHRAGSGYLAWLRAGRDDGENGAPSGGADE